MTSIFSIDILEFINFLRKNRNKHLIINNNVSYLFFSIQFDLFISIFMFFKLMKN